LSRKIIARWCREENEDVLRLFGKSGEIKQIDLRTKVYCDTKLAVYLNGATRPKTRGGGKRSVTEKRDEEEKEAPRAVSVPILVLSSRPDVEHFTLKTRSDATFSQIYKRVRAILLASQCPQRRREVASRPNERQRTVLDDDDDVVRKMLHRENQLRLDPRVQRRFHDAEKRDDTDWIDVATALQREILVEFGLDGASDAILSAYQRAALRHGDVPIHQIFNRSRRGYLRVGDAVPSSLRVVPLRSENRVPLTSLAMDGVPLVLLAGSYS